MEVSAEQRILIRLDQIEAKLDVLADHTPPKYLTVKQAAEHVGTSEGNIRTQLTRRQIPFFKFGNRTLIKLGDLEGMMIRYVSYDKLLESCD